MFRSIAPDSPVFQIPGIGSRVHVLVLISSISSAFAFICSYIVAASLNHSIWVFPYVSDTATCAPETSIFSVFIHLSFISVVCVYYTQYKLVESIYADNDNIYSAVDVEILRTLNLLAITVGLIGSSAMTVAANFPEVGGTSIHMYSGSIAYCFQTVYWIIQSLLQWFPSSMPAGSVITGYSRWARFRMALLASFCLFLASISTSCRKNISSQLWNELAQAANRCNNIHVPESSWYRTDSSRYWYIGTTLPQWILSLLLSLQQYQLYDGFRRFAMSRREPSVD